MLNLYLFLLLYKQLTFSSLCIYQKFYTHYNKKKMLFQKKLNNYSLVWTWHSENTRKYVILTSQKLEKTTRWLENY